MSGVHRGGHVRDHQGQESAGTGSTSKAGNGGIITASQGCESEASAKNVIESIKTSAADAAVVDLTE